MGVKQAIGRLIPRVVFRARDDWRAMRAAGTPVGVGCVKPPAKAKAKGDAEASVDGKPQVTVVFVLVYQQSWNQLASICRSLRAREGVRALVLAVPKAPNNEPYDEAVDTMDTSCEEFCSAAGLDWIGAYNREKGTWVSLEDLEPDYVFYSRPYDDQYPEPYRSGAVARFAKVCYVPYSYNILSGFLLEIMYNRSFIVNCWRVFVCQAGSLRWIRWARPLLTRVRRKVFRMDGYPEYDGLTRAQSAFSREGYEHVVAWFPRWVSSGSSDNCGSHFLQFREDFLAFARRNPDTLCICRPHPLMFGNFRKTGELTAEEEASFRAACVGNVMLDEGGDSHAAALLADAIVTDMTGLMMAFLVMDKPVISCDEGEQAFSEEGHIMDTTFYHASSWSEVEARLDALLEGDDPMAPKRALAREQLSLDGRAGKRIAAHILADAGLDE